MILKVIETTELFASTKPIALVRTKQDKLNHFLPANSVTTNIVTIARSRVVGVGHQFASIVKYMQKVMWLTQMGQSEKVMLTSPSVPTVSSTVTLVGNHTPRLMSCTSVKSVKAQYAPIA